MLLTFLGITLPLLTGGIVTSFYTEGKPSPLLVNASAFLGVLLAVATVWSLVDEWPRRAQLNESYGKDFDQLYVELQTLRPDADGIYDEAKLSDFERRSRSGVDADRADNVSETEKELAWKKALERYP
jgi:hypothetical protein